MPVGGAHRPVDHDLLALHRKEGETRRGNAVATLHAACVYWTPASAFLFLSVRMLLDTYTEHAARTSRRRAREGEQKPTTAVQPLVAYGIPISRHVLGESGPG